MTGATKTCLNMFFKELQRFKRKRMRNYDVYEALGVGHRCTGQCPGKPHKFFMEFDTIPELRLLG
jgi:hypothetical protein